MVFQLFGKGQRLPDQTRHPMAQGVVETSDMVGEAAVLARRAVAVFREGQGVGLPIAGVADGGLAAGRRQGIPQGLRASPAAVADMHAFAVSTNSIHCLRFSSRLVCP